MTFLHSFEPGGVERVALRLVRHWRAMGIDARLFLGREEGALRAELADDLVYA
ncbi:glycosyltransferase, partial [Escherichia coli]|nr:glycosyltransferase [Escherichia coli]